MSFILSALRKAEQDRKRDSDVGSEDWNSADWNALDSSKPSKKAMGMVFATLAALTFCVLILLWLLLRSDRPVNMPTFETSAEDVFVADSLSDEASNPESAPEQINSISDNTEQGLETIPDQLNVTSVSILDDQRSDPVLPVVTGHLFFPSNTSLNRLFGVEGSYKVGHKFDNGLELMEITQYEAVFKQGAEIYKMPLSR